MWNGIVVFVCVCMTTYFLKLILSKEPSRIKFQFNFFIYYFLSSLVALFCCPIFLLRPKNVKNITCVSKLLRHITKLLNLKWEVRNGKILAEERGAVVVINHQSSLDVLGLFNIWETANKMTVIGKKEIFYVWPLGLAAYLGGIVFIDRNNATGAYKQLDTVSEVMTKQKTKILFFPEGTRNKDYTKLLPFKKGAFNMAVRAQVLIIPVLFSPYYFINPKKNMFNKGRVIVQCLEPIPTKGLTVDDIPELLSKTYEIMQTEYMKLSKEVLDSLPEDYPHSMSGNNIQSTRSE